MESNPVEAFIDYIGEKKKVFDFINYVIENFNEYVLRSIVSKRVYECFRSLYPLRHGKRVEFGDGWIAKWIFVKKYGIFSPSPVTEFEIVDVIHKYGDFLKQAVRPEIRGEFCKLVELTCKLSYSYKVEVCRETDLVFHLFDAEKFIVRTCRLKSAKICNDTAYRIIFYMRDNSFLTLLVHSGVDIIPLMETVNFIHLLYRDLAEKAKEVFGRDLEIVEEMEKTVVARIVSKTLSKH
ncbi:MAG: hypothetical protein QXY99_01695 [Thermoproteota archaeon]